MSLSMLCYLFHRPARGTCPYYEDHSRRGFAGTSLYAGSYRSVLMAFNTTHRCPFNAIVELALNSY